MKNFLRSEQGYVLLLTLIFLPVFIGMGLLVLDVGRAQNAQQDHQAAADALALAGARELDGNSGSMARAKAAMAELKGASVNTVSFLDLPPNGGTTNLQYVVDSTSPFRVTFLSQIPATDAVKIDNAYLTQYAAKTDAEARYVHVFASGKDLQTFFFSPVTRKRSALTVGASAVATQYRSTCDLAPIFMCNPYVASGGKSSKERLLEAWNAGTLHGRMVKLSMDPSNANPGPGNIGFLQTNTGRGANNLAGALAGDLYPFCVTTAGGVQTSTTQPGKKTSAINGFNTRFDIHAPNFGGDFGDKGVFPPAFNVRRGWYDDKAKKAGCVTKPEEDSVASASANFPKAPTFSDNLTADTSLGTTYSNVMRKGVWNFAESAPDESGAYTYPSYWQAMYPKATYPKIGFAAKGDADYTKLLASAFGGKEPSRYQVYRYEQTHDANGNVVTDITKSLAAIASSKFETGLPQCYKGTATPGTKDRRVMFVAVVDCATNPTGGVSPVPVDTLAEVFLVNPLKGSSKDRGSDTIDFEFVDISENSNGSIDKYLRTDVVLVR